MRKFLSDTAGATFLQGTNFTFCPRQREIEIIMKIDRGYYAIVNLIQTDKAQGALLANWGDWFSTHLDTEKFRRYIYALRNKCPKFMAFVEGNDTSEDLQIGKIAGGEGIFRIIDLPQDNIINCFNSNTVLDEAEALCNFSHSIYHELITKCPIDEWRKELLQDF